MASKSIDWDELLLTNDPKKKEIEVSFKKIDGDGYLSFGKEPGTPGGVEEDEDGNQDETDDEGDFETDEDNPPENDDPIPPDEPPEECEPGNDCVARWDLSDIAGPEYSWHQDSVLWLRDGFPDHSDGYFGYWSQQVPADTRVGEPQTPADAFVLKDSDGNEIYNGNDESQPPSMGGGRSRILPYLGVNNNPSLKFETPSSPTNSGEPNRNDNRLQMYRRRWAELDPACSGSYFNAPNYVTNINERRQNPGSSIWYESTEVYDPTDPPPSSKWVGPGIASGAEMEHEEWTSVYVMRPYSGETPLSEIYNIFDPQWPTIRISHQPAFHAYVHNGQFGGNVFSRNPYSGGSSIRVSPYGVISYYGSAGAGGFEWFDARVEKDHYLGPDRELDGWYTCRHEKYISAAYKSTNESGDFGVYGSGVTRLTQSFTTWYFNGKQITPRFLTSQFSRPTTDTGPNYIAHDANVPIHEYMENPDAQQRPSYGTLNSYFRESFPLEMNGIVLATYMTKPISSSSRWDANFVDIPGSSTGQVGSQYIEPLCNSTSIAGVQAESPTWDVPVLAYVDHSDIGKGFFSTQAYKNMRRINPKVTPDYCERIPS